MPFRRLRLSQWPQSSRRIPGARVGAKYSRHAALAAVLPLAFAVRLPPPVPLERIDIVIWTQQSSVCVFYFVFRTH